MSWLSDIFTSSAAGIVDSVGNAVDKLVTSDEEKLQLKNELLKIQVEANAKAEDQALQAQQEITKRWVSDNEHAVTRLVRPIAYAWMMSLFSVIAIADGNLAIGTWEFTVSEAYVPVIQALLITMTIAYFGSRGLEKMVKTYKG